MPVYAYRGVNQAGKKTRGHMDADSPRGARTKLRIYPDVGHSYPRQPDVELARARRFVLAGQRDRRPRPD